MLSIVIPTLNEEKYLAVLLKSIRAQAYRNYEIIIADAGSKDKTIEIAKKFKCRIVKGGLPAMGRNNGARAARGDLILFLDADVYLPHNFLEKAISELNSRKLGTATCALIPYDGNPFDYIFFGFVTKFMRSFQNFLPAAMGLCILTRKSVYKLIGGFDESIALAEDVEYVQRAAKVAPFRILRQTPVFFSMRRFLKHGRFNILNLYMRAFIIKMKGGEIRIHNKQAVGIKYF